MGVNTRRPPLPAPTESMDEAGTSGLDTDVATNITMRTDKTSYEIPEDGSPIVIPTQKLTSGADKTSASTRGSRHERDKSQTSLLIEYFEGSRSGEKGKSKPSVRVKVTPSSRKKREGGASDAIHITGIGKDRKPSYTRRISLGGSRAADLGVPLPVGDTEISHSSESNLSSRQPVEIEVLDPNGSDLSTRSRGLKYAVADSNVSSMPPDSMLEGGATEMIHEHDREDEAIAEKEYLHAPQQSRSRSVSRDRITQKVMEKLGQTGAKTYRTGKSRSERSLGGEYHEREEISRERRRKSSKSHQYDDDTVTGAESSLLSSNVSQGHRSYRSASDLSKASRMTNNPRLLEMVEDTIKRMILPEINAIKTDQKTDRNLRSLETSRRASLGRDGDGIERRVSKSSSTPHLSSKPKVVLNREGDDPGTILSRGDSERRVHTSSRREYAEHRSSSRRSSGRHSSYDDEETIRHNTSRSSHKPKEAAAATVAGLAGGVLTAEALHHHEAEEDLAFRSHRKRRSKSRGSRSRSASLADSDKDAYLRREEVPPMPMASRIHDSELTRDSIVSADTERALETHETCMPVREVRRGSIGDAMSPTSSRTPTRTPIGRDIGVSHAARSVESLKTRDESRTTKERVAALAAAGLGGVAVTKAVEDAYDHHVDADGYGDVSPRSARKISSPVQSVSSLRKTFEEDALVPRELRPHSAASRSSAGRPRDAVTLSRTSQRSIPSSPTSKLARLRRQSANGDGDEFVTPLEKPNADLGREATPSTTPVQGESVEEWYQRQHELNDRYRDSLDEDMENRDSFTATNRDSYQTNPYPQDEKRFTTYTDDSQEDRHLDDEQSVKPVGLSPGIVHTPHGVESAVASLMDPSTVSSNLRSSQGSPSKGSYSERMSAQLKEMGNESPAIYEGSTLSQTIPSQARWAALKGHARDMSSSSKVSSPRQSPIKSIEEEQRFSATGPIMTATGVPDANDPLPEIGHFDDSKSDLTTNPSIIHGPLGGDATGKDTWPYTPEPIQHEVGAMDSRPNKDGSGRDDAIVAAGASASAALAAGNTYAMRQARRPEVADEVDGVGKLTPDDERGAKFIRREATPTSPPAFRDEGYVTDGHARSAGALTPRAEQQIYSKKDTDDYNRAMDAQDFGEDDPFTADRQNLRNISGNSHGLSSPLYDSATGNGKDRIQSKDVVFLMDHLTVRDSQRNAVDTEIITTLVRTAAEMRSSFDDMKKFIVEQDRMIMRNTDRAAEHTAQRVLGGPRPQPIGSPRTPRQMNSQDDMQTKRRGVLRRALKGLTGGRQSGDLARVEDMLMQILDNVEDLKHQQQAGAAGTLEASRTNDTLDTYERLRNIPDSGYEPEGQAGTSSTPSQSGGLSLTPRAEKHQFHSGYDGRRGSTNRVSTVLEGDEDDELEHHERHILNNQFENNERLQLTPTQEVQRDREFGSPSGTPYFGSHAPDLTPRSGEKQHKHRSDGTAGAKVSRWSKTTASSAAPDPATLDSPRAVARNARPLSETSRSRSTLRSYDDDGYRHSPGRQHATEAERRSIRSQASRLTRTPSPLIPSEASVSARGLSPDQEVDEDDELDFDDPKYHAHRNSLLLQHPQPRPGQTGRHQNTLENQAYEFDDPSATNSDLSQRTGSDDFNPALWGSSGTAGLAKHRLSQFDPLSPISMATPTAARKGTDEGPLVPSSQQPKSSSFAKQQEYDSPEHSPDDVEDWEPTYSNSGFSRGGYYSSPFGSGHLLEPIEEVRYSLETDSGHISPEPHTQAQVAKAIDVRNTARKITGPRPMVGSSSENKSPQAKLIDTTGTGTVRRKAFASDEGSGGSMQ